MKFLKILKQVIKETNIKDDILSTSPKVVGALTKLLSSNSKDLKKAIDEIEEIVKDINVISYKPSTFRIIFQNDNYFDLVYDPIDNNGNVPESKYYTLFIVAIDGKKYHLVNNSEKEQALDYINRNLKTASIGSKDTGGDDVSAGDDETPEPEVGDKDSEDSKDKEEK